MTYPRVLRWYHGDRQERSTASWKQQRWERDPARESLNESGPGIYFTSSLEQARSYGPYVYWCKLPLIGKIIYPRRAAHLDSLRRLYAMASAAEQQRFLADWQATDPEEVLLKFCCRCGLHDALLGMYGPTGLFREPEDWVQAVTALGYDAAVIHRSYGVKHLVVWNPERFKIEPLEDT